MSFYNNLIRRKINDAIWIIDPTVGYGRDDEQIEVHYRAEPNTSHDKSCNLDVDPFGYFFKSPHPWKVGFELTYSCNLSCKHCYVGNKVSRELSTQEVLTIIDQLVDSGTLWLWLTGGECTTRSDFCEIYTYAKKKGLIVSFLTNCISVHDGILNALIENPASVVKVSLYGATNKSYELFTGHKKGYQVVRRNIEKLRRIGQNIAVQVVVTSINQHEKNEMEQYCLDLGVNYNFTAEFLPTVDGNDAPLLYETSSDKLESDGLSYLTSHYIDVFPKSAHVRREHNENGMYYCGAGFNFVFITPELEVVPCILGRSVGEKISNDRSFLDCFNIIYKKRLQFLKIPDSCRECTSISLCGLCKFRRDMYSCMMPRMQKACDEVKCIHRRVTCL